MPVQQWYLRGDASDLIILQAELHSDTHIEG
jgi:hypothetical protein